MGGTQVSVVTMGGGESTSPTIKCKCLECNVMVVNYHTLTHFKVLHNKHITGRLDVNKLRLPLMETFMMFKS